MLTQIQSQDIWRKQTKHPQIRSHLKDPYENLFVTLCKRELTELKHGRGILKLKASSDSLTTYLVFAF